MYVLVAAGPFAVLFAGCAWLASRLTSLVTGDGWQGTPGSPSALVVGVRQGTVSLPPVVLAVTVMMVMLVLSGLAVLALRWRRRKPVTLGRSRWATRADLQPLAVDDDPAGRRGRIALGRAGRQLLAAEPRHSVCVLGPTGSGKTVSVVVPTLLDWTGPAVVTSVKTDVLEATAKARADLGPVYVYDPTGSTGRPCSTWSPLPSCITWPGASQMAGWLVGTAGSSNTGNGDHERFWSPLARKLLAPLLFAAGAHDLGMADVIRWLDTQEETEVVDLLDELGVVEACNAFTASRRRPPDALGSVYATAEAVVDCFTDPQVAASAAGCDIDPAALLERDGTLYLVAPVHAQDRLRSLFEALVMSVVREAQNLAQAGRVLDPGLLLMLDEAGNVAPLRDLPAIASTGRGQGIQTVSVWQDLAQITDRYGRLASTVINNHRAELALSGITDLDTLDYVSRLIGDTDVHRISVTAQAGGGTSTSRAEQTERLAPGRRTAAAAPRGRRPRVRQPPARSGAIHPDPDLLSCPA